jgi:hypothetical protein
MQTHIGKQLEIYFIYLGNKDIFILFYFFVVLRPNAGHGFLSWRFLDHTQWHTTVGRTPLDEWSAHCRDLYLKTHNTHNRQTSMPPVGFEPMISAGKWPQTYILDRVATGVGNKVVYCILKTCCILHFIFYHMPFILQFYLFLLKQYSHFHKLCTKIWIPTLVG